MNNIEEFIITCEGLMIGEDEIIMENWNTKINEKIAGFKKNIMKIIEQIITAIRTLIKKIKTKDSDFFMYESQYKWVMQMKDKELQSVKELLNHSRTVSQIRKKYFEKVMQQYKEINDPYSTDGTKEVKELFSNISDSIEKEARPSLVKITEINTRLKKLREDNFIESPKLRKVSNQEVTILNAFEKEISDIAKTYSDLSHQHGTLNNNYNMDSQVSNFYFEKLNSLDFHAIRVFSMQLKFFREMVTKVVSSIKTKGVLMSEGYPESAFA